MNTTLAEIVSKIASQGSNPDVSFLKDNPEAQAMLLLALLSNTANNKNTNNNDNNNNNNDEGDKRKYDSIDEAPKKVGRKPVISEEDDVSYLIGLFLYGIYIYFILYLFIYIK
jgi:hypothetical protein